MGVNDSNYPEVIIDADLGVRPVHDTLRRSRRSHGEGTGGVVGQSRNQGLNGRFSANLSQN